MAARAPEGVEGSRGLRLGLVGHPVAHSLSPVIQRVALAVSRLDGEYSLFDVPEEGGLDVHFEALRSGGWDGLNVTLPWKREAALRCDALEGDAAILGVANTLVSDGGRVVGHNTDVGGLVAAVAARWHGWADRALRGRVAAVLGAGGAARAAVLAALRLGAGEVRVWNRTGARADELARALAGQATVVVRADVEAAVDGAALVLQAGSGEMGLAVGSDAWLAAAARAEVVLARTAPEARVVDLVYKPRRTPWVEAAGRLGREADDGLAMLVHQARLAFTLWTGVTVPAEPLLAAVAATVG